MLKLKRLAAYVGAALDQPAGSVVELLRALREAIEATEEVDDPELDRFSARPGPGGGLNVTARMVTYLLIGFLVDQPRAKVFDQMLRAFKATTDEGLCPLTGEKIFGDAVEAILTNEQLLTRVGAIEVSQHFARISFSDGARNDVSFFWLNHATPIKGGFRMMVAPFFTLQALAQFIKTVESELEAA